MATPKQILKIQELKIEAEKAYEEYHKAVEKLFEAEGESKHIVEIEPQDGKNWLRITLLDNVRALNNGENLIGISIVRPIGVKVEYLKNEPKV